MVERTRPGLLSPSIEMEAEIEKLREERYRTFLERISNRDISGRRDAFSGLAPEQESYIRALEKENKMYFTPDEIRQFRTTVNARNNYNRMARQFGSIMNDPKLKARHNTELESLSAQQQEVEKTRRTEKALKENRAKKLSQLEDTMNKLVEKHPEDVDDGFAKRFSAKFKNSSPAEIQKQIDKYSSGPLYKDIGTILSSELPQDRKNLIGKLERSKRVPSASIAKEAQRVLEIQTPPDGELDPVDRGSLETQRMRGGGLISEKPTKLTEDQIAFREQNKLSGSDMRGIAGVQASQDTGFRRTANQLAEHNKWVDDQVKNLPEAWHREGSGIIDPEGTGRELTKAQAWVLKTKLDYGHFGPAASPGYQYMQNWLSNANPESRYYNRLSRDGMTIAEMENAQRMHTANEGFVWTPEHRDATLGRIDNAGLEAPRGGILSLPETTTPLIDDPQRAAVVAGINNSGNQLFSPGGTFGTASGAYRENLSPSEVNLRATFERSLPDFDYDSQRGMGQGNDISPEARQRIENLDKGTLEKFRLAVVDQLKAIKAGDFSQMPTATQILDRAAQSLGRGVLGVAPIALMLADPELAQAYDEMSILKGEALYKKMGETFGLGDVMTAVNQAAEDAYATGKSGVYGPHMAIQSALGEFGWNTVKAGITEFPGLIATAVDQLVGNTGSELQGSVPEGTPYHDFGEHALPQNVVPIQNQGSPHTKYGGLVQPLWPTSASN